MQDARNLDSLFSPRSVAVVGASEDQRKWGNWLALGALRGEHRREVFLVNRRATSVLGRTAYPSLGELPSPPELVVLAIPARSFDTAVDEALAAGAKAIVGITAGLAETGSEGRLTEQAAARRIRDAGAMLLGPNCLGLTDVASELYLASNDLPQGPIGLISQSGNLALELAIKAGQAGLGFSRFASVGNQADLEVADLVADFAKSVQIEVIALYCEDFKDGRRFLEAALAASDAGKPVVLLTLGASQAAARAARSHTGALVSGDLSISAACRAASIERVATPKELVDVIQGLLTGTTARGRRVGILGDGGGHGAIAAEIAEALELEVPAFSEELASELATATGTPGGTSNPVDLAGAGEQDIWSFDRVLSTLLGSDELDSVIVTGYFGAYWIYGDRLGEQERAVALALVELARSSPKPVVVHAMYYGEDAGREPGVERGALELLRAGKVPVYANIEDAVKMIARLVGRGRAAGARLPELPPACQGPGAGGYFPARALLARYGVPVAAAREVSTATQARQAAAELGYPVVVKATALEHKSDAGGVVLGIPSEHELDKVTGELWSRLGPGPLSVESMATAEGGVELLIGTVRDPRFGPIALVGVGGVYAEVLGDVAACLAPVSEEDAEKLICSLRGAPLLLGARGRKRLDISAAARALAALSRAAAAHVAVLELEVNPLLVGPSGAVGLDARMSVVAGTSACPQGGKNLIPGP